MAIKNIVEYTEQGLKIFRPDTGERHLVYVRPGDKINLDFSDDVVFRIVDGDILAILPNGAQVVFLSLGAMSMTADEAQIPKLYDKESNYIDVLNVAEISELSDQNVPVKNRFLDFQPQSEEPTEIQERLSRQEETLQNTLETINDYVSEISSNGVSGPQNAENEEGAEKTGTQTTVEFVQETVEKVIKAPESTTIPEANNPSTQTLTAAPQPDASPQTVIPVVNVPSVLRIDSVDVLGVRGGFVNETREYRGGTGSDRSSTNSTPAYRLESENINTSSGTGGNQDTVVYAENNQLITSTVEGVVTRMAQVISLNPDIPTGFQIDSVSISGLPPGSDIKVYSVKKNPDPQLIDSTTVALNGAAASQTSFVLQKGIDYDEGGSIQFIISYPTTGLTTLSLNAQATATFDTLSGEDTPLETTLTAQGQYTLDIKPVNLSAEDPVAELSGNVLPTNPTGNNITTGSGNDTIFGGSSVDNINAGEGNDTLDGGLGNDVLNGGGGSDTISYATQTVGNSINVKLEDNTNLGTIGINNEEGTIVEEDTVISIENITGTSNNDTIKGNSSDNTLIGGKGNDIIEGGAGNDALDGGEGDDTLSYAYNLNTEGTGYNINLGTGQTTFVNNSVTETDTLSNFNAVVGSSLDDTIIGSAGLETLNGGAGNDIISSGGGEDILIGGENSDFGITIDTQANTTTVIAGDTVDNSAFTVNTDVNLLTGAFTANSVNTGRQEGFENAKGTDVGDVITGSGDDNVVYASDGADIISLEGNEVVSVTINDQNISVANGDTYDLSQLDTAGRNISSTKVDLSNTLNDNVDLNKVTGDVTSTINQTLKQAEHVIGSNVADTITGTEGSNYLAGGAGNDTLIGGGGQDVIDGGAGTDQVRFDSGAPASGFVIDYDTTHQRYVVTDNSIGSSATPSIVMNVEEIVGSNNADTFSGTAGNDIFDGLDGDDIINATLGQDTIYGGAGSDFIDYSASSSSSDNRFVNADVHLVDLATKVSVGTSNSALGDDINLSIDNLAQDYLNYNTDVTLTGLRVDMSETATDDAGLYYHSQYAENIANGVAVFRNNKVYQVENIRGTSSNDYLAGDANNNSLDGGRGHDFLAGRAGNDILAGGAGNDILAGGVGNDTIDGGEGNDWVSYQFSTTNATVDLADTSAQNIGVVLGNDIISNVENVITGSGNDTITGTTGVNSLIGGSGDDTLIGGGGADYLDGGIGSDTADFSSATYSSGVTATLGSPASNNDTSSTATYDSTELTLKNIENIAGSTGNDVLTGNTQNNTLIGNSGDDTLDSGTGGENTLQGGAGNDLLKYNVSSGGSADGGTDIDTLDLSALGTNYTIDLNADNHAGAGFSNTTFNNIENVTTGISGQTIYASSTTDNTIMAGADDDVVHGNSGADFYDGGDNTSAGMDEISYNHHVLATGGSISADFSTNSQVDFTIATNTTTADISNFEKITGSGNNDSITLGNANSISVVDADAGDDNIIIDQGAFVRNNTVIGGGGNDTLSFRGTSGITVDFNSTSENTVVTPSGTPGVNTVTTLSGVETVSGTATAVDILESRQRLEVDGSNVTLANTATTVAFNQIEVLNNQAEVSGSTFQNFDAGNFNTILAGTGQDNFIIMGAAATTDANVDNITLNGGEGNDVLTVGSTGATTMSGSGDLEMTYLASADTYTLVDIETINGGSGNDTWDLSSYTTTSSIATLTINGNDGNDVITGSAGSDIINSGAGTDSLIGGDGNNTFIGGTGNDSYDISGTDTISFADREHAISMTYADGTATNIIIDTNDDNTFDAAVDEQDTISILETTADVTDKLNLTGSTVNDHITITHGTTSNLGQINMNEGTGNTDIDTVNFTGSIADKTINNADVANFSNVEVLDFSGVDALSSTETLTFKITDLYDWAGVETSSIDNGGVVFDPSVHEIQLNFESADFADLAGIRFDLSTSNTDDINVSNSGSSNELSLTDEGSSVYAIDTSTALTAGEYHVVFDDAGGGGQNLHVVVNVT